MPGGAIASRLGEFDDIKKLESENATDQTLIEALIGSKSVQHNNYQDFDAFLKAGGKIGLQHDPLLYGAYLLNPFLVRVEEVPDAGRQAGRGGGHQGLRRPADRRHLRGRRSSSGRSSGPAIAASGRSRCGPASMPSTRRCYEAEHVPTAILSLNWSEAVSEAHKLDERLSQIVAKSREGFVFTHRVGRADPRARHAPPRA